MLKKTFHWHKMAEHINEILPEDDNLAIIEVQGKKYPGQVPMTPFGAMLNDDEIAAVLTYVRKSFGNNASAVSPAKVKQVREATKDTTGFYSPEELLKQHPMENKK